MSTQLLTPNPDDIVGVVTYLPARLAPAFQRASLSWLEQAENVGPAGASYVAPFERTAGPKDPWDLSDWNPDTDGEAAAWVLRDCGEQQRRILGRLLVTRGRESAVSTDDLKAFARYRGEQTAGPIMKAIVGRFRAVGRRPIWQREPAGYTDAGTMLLFVSEGPPRDLFLQALTEQWAALAQEAGL